MTTLRHIPSVGWQKLQPVSHKSISGAMQVHEHGAGCIFNSTCFNPKRSGNRSMNALVVADGNVLDCPHCQARGPGPGGSADIIVSLWFCLELQTQRAAQTVTLSCLSARLARSATISSLSLHLQSQPRQPSKKITVGLLQL